MVKIYIDPGHGGTDPGATGNGLREKDINLSIARRIRDYLRIYGNADVRMSRTGDQTVALDERTNDANSWGADYFLSIHINAGGGVGYEDFIHSDLSDSSATARIRDIMHAEIIKENRLNNRGKKKANFHVLRETNMPAILTENGFIDHKGDSDKMKQQTWIDDVAVGHVNGLVKALDLVTVPEPEDNERWRIQTGLFDNASTFAKAIDRLSNSYSWTLHEQATTTELNPRYRIVTGLFTGKNVAEYHAEQVRREFGWNVHVVER